MTHQQRSASFAAVTIITPTLSRGGTQRVVVNLANYWGKAGVEVTVVSLHGSERAYEIDSSVHVVHCDTRPRRWFPIRSLLRFMSVFRCLRRTLRSTSGPVLSLGASANLMTIVATTGMGRHLVVSERNDLARESISLTRRLGRRLLYRRATKVTTNGEHARRYLARFIPESKLDIVRNPLVIPERVTPASLDSPALLAVGRLHRQKGFDVLLEAFAQSKMLERGWNLVILGDGAERDPLARLAAELGLGDRVQWRGSVGDPFPYYAAATVFVLPSRFEGVSNALLEAMAFGLPCVVSTASIEGLLGMAMDDAALVVETEDVGSLRLALDQAGVDRALRRRLGERARDLVTETHRDAFSDWERVLAV